MINYLYAQSNIFSKIGIYLDNFGIIDAKNILNFNHYCYKNKHFFLLINIIIIIIMIMFYNILIFISNFFHLVLYTIYLVIHLYLFFYIKIMHNSIIILPDIYLYLISNIKILIIH